MVSVVNSIDTSHEDLIHDAQLDYYGLRLATCSSDRTIRVFDVKHGQHTFQSELRGHEGPVWQVAWAHPKFGTILASCSYDRKVIIWSETDRQWSKLYEHSVHESSVNSIAWAPHEFGLLLACASSDASISLLYLTGDGQWDCKRIQNAHALGCNAVSWAPAVAPRSLIVAAPESRPTAPVKRLASCGSDTLVKIWKEENGEWIEESKLEGHADWVRDVAWAPSIGLSKNQIASCSQEGRVIVWNNDGVGSNWTPTVFDTTGDVVWHVSWSLAGNILAVSGGDNKVTLWKETVEGRWMRLNQVFQDQGHAADGSVLSQ